MENNEIVDQSDDEGEIFIDSSNIQSEFIVDGGDAQGLDLDEDMDDSSANPEESSGEKPKDDSIQRFLSHKDSVYCIAIHPECDLNANVNTVAITGGGDEVAFIFNITTGTELFRLSGHTDSIVSVGFNFNGKLVATGSYDATVKIWETETGKLLFTLEGPQNEIEWVQWHAKGNVVLAGSRDGNIWMWNTVDGKCMAVFGGHTAPVTCGGFSADGKLVVSGSEDATVRIWDPKTSGVIHTLKGHGFHTEPITCIETHPNNVVASGSAEGEVKLTNMVNGKLMGALSNHDNSIEALAFSPIAPFLATGSMDSKINLYDLSTLQLRGSCKHDDGITRLVWHPTEPFVFAASVDKTVRLWDGRSAQCAKVWTGHDNTILDLALTKDGAYFLTASDDQASLVFKV